MNEEARHRILIVDDEPYIREILHEFIEQHIPNVDIFEAGDGAEAVRKIWDVEFDLVIADIRMPEANGVTLLRAMKSLTTGKRLRNVIVISGHTPPDALSQLGVTYFFQKPIALNRFLVTVKHCLKLDVSDELLSEKIPSRVDLFINAALQELTSMLGESVAIKQTLKKGKGTVRGDVSAVIALNSTSFSGNMVLSFGEEVYCRILEIHEKETHETLSEENAAYSGEMLNRIFLETKAALRKRGDTLAEARPHVVCAKNHSVSASLGDSVIEILLTSTAGDFILALTIDDKRS